MAVHPARRDVKYRRNKPVPYHMRFGRKVIDPQTGFPTYEERLVEDEWGMLSDPRFGGNDIRDQDTDIA